MADVPWGVIAPIIVIQVVLAVIAIRDLVARPAINGPKWVWAIVIVLLGLVGPVLYLTLGRRES